MFDIFSFFLYFIDIYISLQIRVTMTIEITCLTWLGFDIIGE